MKLEEAKGSGKGFKSNPFGESPLRQTTYHGVPLPKVSGTEYLDLRSKMAWEGPPCFPVLNVLNAADRTTWTFAHCSFCDRIEYWKWMAQKRVFWQPIGSDDPTTLYVRECWECRDKRLRLGGEGPARKHSMENAEDYKRKCDAIESFQTCVKLRRSFFPALHGAPRLRVDAGDGRPR